MSKTPGDLNPKTVIEPQQVACLDIVHSLLSFRAKLNDNFGVAHVGSQHGNARLQLVDLLIVLLAAFFNPFIRSHRLIEALSAQAWMQQRAGMARVPRSTLSDALRRFDPQQLRPLIAQLVAQIPQLKKRDGDLARITRQVLAADGSFFNLAGEAVWALQSRHRKSHAPQWQTRWNLQLDIDAFAPVDADVSGGDEKSEAAAFMRRLRPDVIYLIDRGFVHFGFINAVLKKNSSLVLRLKKSTCFAVESRCPLTDKDRTLSVIGDETGYLSGPVCAGNNKRRSRTQEPPAQRLRRVTLVNPETGEQVYLLTDMLDVPAHVIGLLYRKRWQVELFLRWLKCEAAFEHALSRSPRGVTMQLYVAMIGTLLLHLATKRRVSKYTMFWMNSVAAGLATWDQMERGLERIEREKSLEKARLEKKKLAKAAAKNS